MFHVFPVVKRRGNTTVIEQESLILQHIIGPYRREWDSPTEVVGKRQLTTIHNHKHHDNITRRCEDAL